MLKHDLADERWLRIHPLTSGNGKKLFGDGTIPAAFTLVDSTATPSGVIAAHYKRAGEVVTGTMVAYTWANLTNFKDLSFIHNFRWVPTIVQTS